MSNENIKEFIKLKENYEAKQQDLKDLRMQIIKVEARVLDSFADDGITKVSMDGKTVHLSTRKTYKLPQGEDKMEFFQLIEALHGKETLEGMMTVNSQTLNSYLRNLGPEEQKEFEKIVDEPNVFTQLKLRRN